MKRVLVHNGSSANILFLETFKNIKLDETMMRRKVVSLNGFDGRSTSTIGKVELPIFTKWINFHTTYLVIKSKLAYNMILCRP